MFSINKKIMDWMIIHQKPINQDINEKLKKLEEQYKQTQNRINIVSDYLQNNLQKIIHKAINKYFKELENIIKQQKKKDK